MKSERQLLEDPFYGEPKSSDSHPGKFKGKMKWPLGREAPLKPIDVYLTISDANYWRGVAILDKPFDRVVVSIKKGLPDGVYSTSDFNNNIFVKCIYDGMIAGSMVGTVKFDTKMGNLKITDVSGSFEAEHSRTPDMPAPLKNAPPKTNKETSKFKLSCNFEFLDIAKSSTDKT
ncbi:MULTISPECIES: hypothetical protein [Pseudomonas]|jgi:hypothetical protein|uniref:hypothetical protein n=1 Tax=Pseudomonas TaxID=286 RepID=UPI00076127EC|nr:MULTISPECIES: hypothetical protein [Pseudomonas]